MSIATHSGRHGMVMGLNGSWAYGFIAEIPHGKVSREVRVDVPVALVLRLAEVSNACGIGVEPGHVLWHIRENRRCGYPTCGLCEGESK